jgi:serine/threonine protein kinase
MPDPSTESETDQAADGTDLNLLRSDVDTSEDLDFGQGSPAGSSIQKARTALANGDFEILEEIGRGGMGVVYKARQKSLDRLVALKMLPDSPFAKSDGESLVDRFLTEARAAAALSHPNIVTVYQVGQSSIGYFIAMEFIDGQTVEQIVSARVLPIPWTVSLMISVADAVDFAHAKGIVHRDLKPANIMIDKLRRPVVMDFGIAKVMGKSSGLTQKGELMGTPTYMSPEQANEEHDKVGPLSDVYSLGAILYRMLTNRVPFDGGNAVRTILKVVSPEPPLAPRSIRPEIPQVLEDICMKALSKPAEDRYPSAKAFADELRRFRASLTTRPAPKTQTDVTLPKLLLPVVVLELITNNKKIRLQFAKTVIGRAADCDVILRSSDVSKRHCQIIIEPNRVSVEDLGSTNGTSVNNEPIERCELADGDALDIAGHVFKVHITMPRR